VDQAAELATARLIDLTSEYLTGGGTCYFGNNTVRAGISVDISGLGERFGGRYRLQSVTHQFSYLGGYSTTFRAKAVVS
jgi:phage protein D